MRLKLLDYLVCPECKGNLTIYNIEWNNQGHIVSGRIKCNICLKEYPIVNCIPRFVKNDAYVSSFSKEWTTYKQTQLDSVSGLKVSEVVFFDRTGFILSELKEKIVLDAGCGIGRFMEVARKYSDYVVGVDLSYSVDVVYQNLGQFTNVDIVQADIMKLPFRENVFDMVFSLGVLHHTYNTYLAFEKVAKLVKPEGKMAVWVYSNDGLKMKMYNTIANFYRFFTTRLPQNVLHKLCWLSVPLYYIHKLPIIGNVTRILLPTSMEKLPDWRILDTFDWYSPKYQYKHTYKEVNSWYNSLDFRDIKPLHFPVSMQGIKTQ